MSRAGVRTVTPDVQVRPAQLSDSAVLSTWEQLQKKGGVPTPFLSWQWFSALAEVPQLSRLVQVLVVTAAGEDVGLFPMEFGAGPAGIRSIGAAGGRWLAPDHLDVVAPPEARTLASEAILRYLKRLGAAELIELEGLDAAGSLAQRAEHVLERPRFVTVSAAQVPVPTVELTGKGEHELFPSRNLRQQVGRGLRAAERMGGGFEVVADADRVGKLLPELMRLHNARFQDSSVVFSGPQKQAFHILAARKLAEAGMARVYRLSAGGANVALLYAFVLEDRVYYYSMGIDPGGRLSPGRTLLGQAILTAAREGFSEFDLLRGVHPYKSRFANRVRYDAHLRYLRTSPVSLLKAVWHVVLRRIDGARAPTAGRRPGISPGEKR